MSPRVSSFCSILARNFSSEATDVLFFLMLPAGSYIVVLLPLLTLTFRRALNGMALSTLRVHDLWNGSRLTLLHLPALVLAGLEASDPWRERDDKYMRNKRWK